MHVLKKSFKKWSGSSERSSRSSETKPKGKRLFWSWTQTLAENYTPLFLFLHKSTLLNHTTSKFCNNFPKKVPSQQEPDPSFNIKINWNSLKIAPARNKTHWQIFPVLLFALCREHVHWEALVGSWWMTWRRKVEKFLPAAGKQITNCLGSSPSTMQPLSGLLAAHGAAVYQLTQASPLHLQTSADRAV